MEGFFRRPAVLGDCDGLHRARWSAWLVALLLATPASVQVAPPPAPSAFLCRPAVSVDSVDPPAVDPAWLAAWDHALAARDPEEQQARLVALAGRVNFRTALVFLGLVESIASTEHRFHLHRILLATWAAVDGAAALAYANSLPPSDRPPELFDALYAAWLKVDLTAALEWFQHAPQRTYETEFLRALARSLAGSTPERLEEAVAHLTDASHSAAFWTLFIQESPTVPPATLARLVAQLSPGDDTTRLVGQVILAWARTDWSSALAWTRNLPPGPSQLAALLHLVPAWVEHDATSAAYFAAASPDNAVLVSAVVSQWTRQAPEAAAAWARQLPDGPSRQSALATVLATWSGMDPLRAFEYVRSIPPASVSSEMLVAVLSNMGRQFPSIAFQHASVLVDDATRVTALENLFYRWTAADPQSATIALRTLAQGPARDAVLSASVAGLLPTDPDLALAWAAQIHDAGLHDAQIAQAAQAWLARDPLAARAWIRETDLPEFQKAQLLGP